MKVRINLTNEEHLLSKVKRYAAKKNTSVSDLVEEYFKKVVKPSRQKTIIDLMEEFKGPDIDLTKDLNKEYYEGQSKKYGF